MNLLQKYMALIVLEEGITFVYEDVKPPFITVEEWKELNEIAKSDFNAIINTKLPCQKICKLSSNSVCIGCNRTTEEIECSGKDLQKV